jgi:hypothetical protein
MIDRLHDSVVWLGAAPQCRASGSSAAAKTRDTGHELLPQIYEDVAFKDNLRLGQLVNFLHPGSSAEILFCNED